MDHWPHPIKTYTMAEVQEHVYTTGWQLHRENMKGRPTTTKLDMLSAWRELELKGLGYLRRRCEVQIDNYLNALKRGGLLDANYHVVR